MKFKDRLDGEVAIFELSGKIMGGPDATMFHGRMFEYISLNKRKFLVDLAGVQWTNSQGLGMLLGALNAARSVDGRLVLTNIESIRSLMAVSRLTSMFEHYGTREDALRHLSDRP